MQRQRWYTWVFRKRGREYDKLMQCCDDECDKEDRGKNHKLKVEVWKFGRHRSSPEHIDQYIELDKTRCRDEPILYFCTTSVRKQIPLLHSSQKGQAPLGGGHNQNWSSHASGELLRAALFPTSEYPRGLTAGFSLWRNTSVATS